MNLIGLARAAVIRVRGVTEITVINVFSLYVEVRLDYLHDNIYKP